MSDQQLYQAVILEHNKKPRNFGELEEATHKAEGFNPLCGDRFNVYMSVDGSGKIETVKFEGHGCAISKASASLMTDALKGKTTQEAEALFENFHNMVTGKSENADSLGKLRIFSTVSRFPSRVKCAALAWHTMKGALANEAQISTE